MIWIRVKGATEDEYADSVTYEEKFLVAVSTSKDQKKKMTDRYPLENVVRVREVSEQ